MKAEEFFRAVEEGRDCDCEGLTMPGSERPWGVRWNCGGLDPFTGELPETWYFTSAEAIRAAGSMGRSYDPSQFAKVTEPVA